MSFVPEPPPVQGPAFDFAPEPKAPIHGWVMLFLVFGFLVFVALSAYFAPPDPNAEVDWSRLKMEYRLSTVSSGTLPDSRRQHEKAMSELLDRALLAKTADIEKDRLIVSLSHETYGEANAKSLAKLKASKKQVDRTLAEIYSAKSLEKEAAERLVGKLPKDDDIVIRMAAVHARKKAKDPKALERSFPPGDKIKVVAAGLMFVAGILGGGLAWLVYFGVRKSGKLTPLGHPAGTLNAADAHRFALRATQLMGAYMLIQVGGLFAVQFTPQLKAQVEKDETGFGLILQLVWLLIVMFLFLLPVEGKRITPKILGLSFDNFGKNTLWGVAGAFANVPVIFALSALSQWLFQSFPESSHPTGVRLMETQDAVTVGLSMVAAAVLAPIIEEITFRGVMAPALTRLFQSVAMGIASSSLMFAAIHPQGVPGWLPLGAVGAMAALLTYQTRSLVPAIVMHAVNNTSALLLTILLA